MYERMRDDVRALMDKIDLLSENHQELEEELTFIKTKLCRLFPKWTRESGQ
jgi:hypothetical protein